jgi:hypothetical protein
LATALLYITVFHLSSFDLLDRSISTATGEQKITIACKEAIALPRSIAGVEELPRYGCEFIRLEEKDARQAAGEYVTEVFRADPNVHTRSDIYRQVLYTIGGHPIRGIGFGNIAAILGTDDRGAGLNASNIFLEVWLGAGIVGGLAFLFFWLGLGARFFYRGVKGYSRIALILAPVWVTLTIFNFFNAGLFLGFFFVCLALFLITPTHKHS